jgi:hypothetical protein
MSRKWQGWQLGQLVKNIYSPNWKGNIVETFAKLFSHLNWK